MAQQLGNLSSGFSKCRGNCVAVIGGTRYALSGGLFLLTMTGSSYSFGEVSASVTGMTGFTIEAIFR